MIIANGGLFNLKDASSNCISNCKLYLPNGHCVYCDTGYVTKIGKINTCIAAASCTKLDTTFNICLDSPF